ncbi:MAG: DUF4129 domain-containing protein [Gaiellaceae bacterium]
MSNGRRLAFSGAALLTLLALVAVASRAHRPGGGAGAPPAHPPTLLIHYLGAAMFILFPFGVLLVIWSLAYRRREAAVQGKTSWRRTAVTVAILLGLLAVFRFVVVTRSHGGLHLPGFFHQGGKASSTKHGAAHPPPVPAKDQGSDWLAVYVLGSIVASLVVVAAAAIVHRRRSGGEWDAEADLAAALDVVLKDTLEDLRGEVDPRTAVIRTYARMEQTFAAYGVPRQPAEAPLEYVARVLERLQVSASAVERLTKLFARAKFSTHEIDAGMKVEAIEALTGLRAELEHMAEAA